MSTATLNLSPELYRYLTDISLREPDVLSMLRQETSKLSNVAVMQISPEQGQFMRLILELMQARKTLDIGTFTGYSALAAAMALPDDGKVIACDINEDWTGIARKFWEMGGVTNKIELRLGPAVETLQTLIDEGEAESFDFAFIDADKANYSHYYDLAFQLIRKGGLIAVDNVLWDGKVADPDDHDQSTEAIRALNKKILHDDRVTISMLPIGDGLTLTLKK